MIINIKSNCKLLKFLPDRSRLLEKPWDKQIRTFGEFEVICLNIHDLERELDVSQIEWSDAAEIMKSGDPDALQDLILDFKKSKRNIEANQNSKDENQHTVKASRLNDFEISQFQT